MPITIETTDERTFEVTVADRTLGMYPLRSWDRRRAGGEQEEIDCRWG
jgi:hypothetical protein